jgi:DNA-binding MarR family transcriptional regulator
MKLFDCEIKSSDLAELVAETTALVARATHCEMRKHRPKGLSLQQFRALAVIKHHPGASLSLVADHLGLTRATASKLVDILVKKQLVTRVESSEDRRLLVLNVTTQGEQALETAKSAAVGWLAEVLGGLCESERSVVAEAMKILQANLNKELGEVS